MRAKAICHLFRTSFLFFLRIQTTAQILEGKSLILMVGNKGFWASSQRVEPSGFIFFPFLDFFDLRFPT